MPRVVVYVLCHDDASEAIARASFGAYPWAHPLRIPSTPYRETVVFDSLLAQRRDEWKDADYVGTLSWRAHWKIRVPDIQAEVDAECERRRLQGRPSSDVWALWPSPGTRLLEQATTCHPRFADVWCPLLRALGYDDSQTRDPAVPAFFGNYWMASPEWMERYMAFYTRAKLVMDTDPGLQDALWSDARYGGAQSPERCLEIFGRPYYTHHAFIGERLPCFFFWAAGASVYYNA